jgi:hypothetical protein
VQSCNLVLRWTGLLRHNVEVRYAMALSCARKAYRQLLSHHGRLRGTDVDGVGVAFVFSNAVLRTHG